MRPILYGLLFIAVAFGEEKSKRICEPGSQVKVVCNTCYCLEDSSGYKCSAEKCFGKHSPLSTIAKDERRKCDPGNILVNKNEVCICVTDGSDWICTDTVDSEQLRMLPKTSHLETSVSNPATEEVKSCNPGDIVVYKNQVCICVSDGSGWVCTDTVDSQKLQLSLKLSHPGTSASSPVAAKVKNCNPGDIVVYENQVCVCTDDGTGWICTDTVDSEQLRMLPKTSHLETSFSGPATEEVKSCNPGDIVVYKNQVCICVIDGSDWDCKIDRDSIDSYAAEPQVLLM